jgi:hypothetical protein
VPITASRPSASRNQPIDDIDEEDDEPLAPPPRAPGRSAKSDKSRAVASDFDDGESFDEPEDKSEVSEVWSRWGEWGSTLTRIALVAAGVLFLTYLAFEYVSFAASFGVLVLGFAAVVLLSYPIAITLERPIRMTPEQAVKDFYAAASHHFPHYRRMWLLLSDDGKTSPQFESFAAFQTYWKETIAELKRQSGSNKPLTFRVVDFNSDKSAGRTWVEAGYQVTIVSRAAESGKPIRQVNVVTSLVKGPDRMWYLDRGTL